MLKIIKGWIKVRIEGTIIGCYGAEGMTGFITKKDNANGMMHYDKGVNVKTEDGDIWRVNPDAVKYIENGRMARIARSVLRGRKKLVSQP